MRVILYMEEFDAENYKIAGRIIIRKERDFLKERGYKWCGCCKKAKSASEYWNKNFTRSGAVCKECGKRRKKEQRDEFRAENPRLPNLTEQEKKENRKRERREWFIKNKEKKNQQNRDYYHANKEKCYKRIRKSVIKRRTTPKFKIERALRQRLRGAVLKGFKSDRALNLLGCSVEEFKLYIESLWVEGMSWDNYGLYGWHLDHRRPCSSFDLLDPEQQKICFHWSNMQPLWARDNLRKSWKIIEKDVDKDE